LKSSITIGMALNSRYVLGGNWVGNLINLNLDPSILDRIQMSAKLAQKILPLILQ